jgi:two-component system sensor histidine kinase UhpB
VAQATVVVRRVNSRATVQVADEGYGFDPLGIDPAQTGLGLSTMRERAQEIGGEVDIHSACGSGTQVTVSLPLTGT